MDNKKPWMSKTLWINAILAIAAFFPGINNFFVENAQVLPVLITLVNIVLRLVTKKPIAIE